MRVQRTRSSPSALRSPLTRHPLGHAGILVAVAIGVLAGCATAAAPNAKRVLAYQTPDGQWHDDVSRVVAPVISKKVDPYWPPELRTSEDQGVVLLKLLISGNGVVQDVVVIGKLNDAMDRQALEAARQWAYEPATVDGQPVTVWLKVAVTWRLS